MSVTRTVNSEVPACFGFPESTPWVVRVRLAGSVPDTTVKWYGDVPPEDLRVTRYCTCTVPAGRVEGDRGRPTVTGRVALAVRWLASPL